MVNSNRRLLSLEPASVPVVNNQTGTRNYGSYINETNFDTNMVIILAALLCALIGALGLNSIVRCAMRCSRRFSETPEQTTARLAATGLKKSALRQIPVVVYGSGANLPATECPICLGEFVDGEKVRVLPKCNHGFHVRCIDTWLMSHSSCPNCRHSLLEQRPTTSNSNSTTTNRDAEDQPPENFSGSDDFRCKRGRRTHRRLTGVADRTMQVQGSSRQQSWKVKVHAKFKSIDFKLRVSNFCTTSNFFHSRLSLRLRLHKFFLKVTSASQHAIQGETRALKSKFRRILRKFRVPRAHIAAKCRDIRIKLFPSKEAANVGWSSVIGNDGANPKSLVSILKKFDARKTRTFLGVAVVAVLATSFAIGPRNHTNGNKEYISESICKAWSYAASLL
ncbi:Zinc finger, RING-type [Dillenia turbinata]|uniref:RING-type E3 ubiquitin transferase n=1 Tax=Dillenia turbinata TaxID=194707 RepID=A0AAN8VYY6_9MAGN